MKQKNKEISKSQKNNNIDKSLPRHGDRKSKTQRQKINMKEEVEEEEKNQFFKEVSSQIWAGQYPVEYSSRILFISPELFLYAALLYLVIFPENSACFSLHKLSAHIINSRNPCLGTLTKGYQRVSLHLFPIPPNHFLSLPNALYYVVLLIISPLLFVWGAQGKSSLCNSI